MIFLLQVKWPSLETAELTDCYLSMAEMYISIQHSVHQLLDELSPKAFLVTHKKKS
jgi:hypothetical protein